MKITAVVVTYNRLALLKECIQAIREQNYPPTDILVVNNSSTDGTADWLAQQPGIRVVHQANEGGAFGFQTGIREAYLAGADWVWIMDDDTIPYPDTLAEFAKAIRTTQAAGEAFGYFASKVIWTDGGLHHRNKVVFNRHFKGKMPAEWYRSNGILPIFTSTFVSIIVSREAIRTLGLPLKEFFIWWDDSEYTFRISKNGFPCALVPTSVVLHKTPENDNCTYFNDNARNLWKHRHGMRNELYVKKHYKSYGSYVRNLFRRFVIWPFLIAANRKDDRWLFIKTAWRSAYEALSFDPPRQYAEEQNASR